MKDKEAATRSLFCFCARCGLTSEPLLWGMIIPPLLKPGDCIGIIAPGRKVSPEQIEPATKIIQSWGLEVTLSANLFSQRHSYLAGTDEERLSDIQSMINDPSISAILCARGGYGSSRLVDQIDFSPLKTNPKWIIGFSDVTAIHLKLFSLGIQSIHGTMPLLFSKEDSVSSIINLKETLLGSLAPISIRPTPRNRSGQSEGRLLGGNLSLIVDALGTSSEPDTDGCILLIEEIEEYKYKIDRMMNHLNRAGKLRKLSALVVGHMTNVLDTELTYGESVEDIILHHVAQYAYPVVFNFPSGHENPNLAWRSGGMYALTSSAEKVELISTS